MIIPDALTGIDPTPITFDRRGETHFESSRGVARSMYLLSLASDVELPPIFASFYAHTGTIGALPSTEELAQLRLLATTRNGEISDRDARLVQLTREISNRDARLNQNEAELNQERNSNAARLKRLAAEIKAKDREIAAKVWQIGTLNQQISTILTSTSWRITRPVRVLKRLLTTGRLRSSGTSQTVQNGGLQLDKSRQEHTPSNEEDAIRSSGMFDENHYSLSAEARRAGMDPLRHYIRIGEAKGAAPSTAFDPIYYSRRYRDLRNLKSSKLFHYAKHGRHEGRRPVSDAANIEFPYTHWPPIAKMSC